MINFDHIKSSICVMMEILLRSSVSFWVGFNRPGPE